MFCPNCGTESNNELNYCKRCGGNLNPLPSVSSPTQVQVPTLSTGVIASIGLTTLLIVIGGLTVLSITLSEMLTHGRMTGEALVWIFIFGAATILGSVALLLRFMLRILGGRQVGELHAPRAQPKLQPGAVEFAATPVNLLPADRPVPSVTEHTTRTFDMENRGRRVRD